MSSEGGDGGVSQLQMSYCCPLFFSPCIKLVPFEYLSEFGYVIWPRKQLNAHRTVSKKSADVLFVCVNASDSMRSSVL